MKKDEVFSFTCVMQIYLYGREGDVRDAKRPTEFSSLSGA